MFCIEFAISIHDHQNHNNARFCEAVQSGKIEEYAKQQGLW